MHGGQMSPSAQEEELVAQRGATSVTLVEQNTQICHFVAQNKQASDSDSAIALALANGVTLAKQ